MEHDICCKISKHKSLFSPLSVLAYCKKGQFNFFLGPGGVHMHMEKQTLQSPHQLLPVKRTAFLPLQPIQHLSTAPWSNHPHVCSNWHLASMEVTGPVTSWVPLEWGVLHCRSSPGHRHKILEVQKYILSLTDKLLRWGEEINVMLS